MSDSTVLGKGDIWTHRKGWELAQERTVTGVCNGKVWKAYSEGKYYNEAGGRGGRKAC